MEVRKVFIEVSCLTEAHISGIGHMTLELIRALEKHPDNQKKFEIILTVAWDRKKSLKRWGFQAVRYKSIPIPMRLFNIIWKFDLLPPVDIWVGKGIYIFPNYKNWRLMFSKSMTFVCDISYLLYPQFVSPKNQKFLAKNINKWVKRTDKVLAISKNSQTEIIENLVVDPAKTLLVPCGVDTSIFYKRAEDKVAQLKKSLGISKKYILYLGNIEPRKNISRLIAAYKLLPENLRSQYSLLLVGGGGWLNEPILEEIAAAQAEGYDIIKPDKYVADKDLPALHSGATLLVHPALYEGFGLSPLQAMACGTPVIVANNSALPEVVGDAALLVDADSEQDISDKIRKLLEDFWLRKELSDKGKQQARKYTWDASAQLLVDELGIK
ncbi:MAG: glycosyltransferase family 1 protein [Patescibacteria group bacterium]